MKLFLFYINIITLLLLAPEISIAKITTLDILIQNNKKIILKVKKNSTIKFGNKKRNLRKTQLDITNSKGKVVINGVPFTGKVTIIPTPGSFIKVTTKGGRTYDGTMSIEPFKKNKLKLINHVAIEDYIASVVSSEISPKWHMEMLKTQAIASRTYALYKLQKNHYLVDTVLDQVYFGRHVINKAVRRAVAATKGMVLIYEGGYAMTVFHSTTVGYTEPAEHIWGNSVPYLKGVLCPDNKQSPVYYWEKTFSLDNVAKKLKKAGYNTGFIVSIRPHKRYRSGRINTLKIVANNNMLITGENLRKTLGYSKLPSTRFNVKTKGRNITFLGFGAGHGVGLCQYGAKKMAENGSNYNQILAHYYPGTTLATMN